MAFRGEMLSGGPRFSIPSLCSAGFTGVDCPPQLLVIMKSCPLLVFKDFTWSHDCPKAAFEARGTRHQLLRTLRRVRAGQSSVQRAIVSLEIGVKLSMGTPV